MKIYLDVCCLNRPFDDQTQGRIHMEAEAVLLIMERVEVGELEMVGSDAALSEIRRIPDSTRRRRVEILYGAAARHVMVDDAVAKRAAEIEKLGIRGLDAIHVACAESAAVDVMLTTDDHIVKVVMRAAGQLGVKVQNPVQFLTQEALS
jgi:predicted nucleic acid-binding protein